MTNEDKATQIIAWGLDHWVAVVIALVVLTVTAFLATALTEWRKRHISKNTEVKVEGWIIQKTLALSSALFGGLAVLLPFMHTYLPVLSSLKYVGGFMVSVYAAGNFLYSWKFKSWYKSVQSYLEARRNKLEAKASGVPTEQSQPLEQPILTQPDTPFEVTT